MWRLNEQHLYVYSIMEILKYGKYGMTHIVFSCSTSSLIMIGVETRSVCDVTPCQKAFYKLLVRWFVKNLFSIFKIN